MDNKIYFSEKQRFKQIWLWIILLGTNLLFIFGLIKQVFFGQQFGDKPESDTELIIATTLTLFLSLFFFNMKLETKIKTDGIYVRFFPFQLKFEYYPWGKLNKVFVRTYNPMGEYTG